MRPGLTPNRGSGVGRLYNVARARVPEENDNCTWIAQLDLTVKIARLKTGLLNALRKC